MTDLVANSVFEIVAPDISQLVTEDDQPVDNIPSAKQQRLLVEPLYSSRKIERRFFADANVGVFTTPREPPIVPDMLLSLDVEVAEDWWAKEHRSYFIWEFGKPPDVVVEIVSNKEGNETSKKLRDYARMRVSYYVIYDPQLLIQAQVLQIYELVAGEYRPRPDYLLPKVDLELTLWEGLFEDKQAQWLRWSVLDGEMIPTGAERADQEHARAERLAAKLKALGIDPESE
ncbi:MAG: Uma2 family endonuclease [Chloroflexi bacterium]|nr:Uma2 family endonuclease [Chloroflexota bacterium]